MRGIAMKGTKPKKKPLSEWAKVRGFCSLGLIKIDRPIPINTEKMVERPTRRKVAGKYLANISPTGLLLRKEYPKLP